MDDIKIEIEIDSDESFKQGVNEIYQQLAYLSSLQNEIEYTKNKLLQFQKDALREYCSLDHEVSLMIMYVPKHLAKHG